VAGCGGMACCGGVGGLGGVALIALGGGSTRRGDHDPGGAETGGTEAGGAEAGGTDCGLAKGRNGESIASSSAGTAGPEPPGTVGGRAPTPAPDVGGRCHGESGELAVTSSTGGQIGGSPCGDPVPPDSGSTVDSLSAIEDAGSL